MLHFAWVPLSKTRELKGALAENLKCFFYECARKNGWHIEKLIIELDHVYMVVKLDCDVSPDAMLKKFKCYSDKKIYSLYPDFDEFLWGKTLWTDGYFVATQGCCDENDLRQYIKACSL